MSDQRSGGIAWTEETRKRFWSYVDQSAGPDACWPWKRGAFTNGYGQFRVGKRKVRAHRAAYELTHGLLGDRIACHHCDRPKCCNPTHLFAGTHADNAHDRERKGRGVHKGTSLPGVRNPAAKITVETVASIRELARSGRFQRDIAKAVGLSQSQVGNIVRGKCWAA